MSWTSGTMLMEEIIDATKENDRVKFFSLLINMWWNHDCDTLGDLWGVDPDFDKALEETGYLEEDEE